MAVRIRLTRIGAKKRPYYRIVAADSEAPRDGRFLEILGSYDPNPTPALVEIKTEQLAKWLEKGAKPSTTVFSLLKNNGLWPGDKSPAASPAG